MERSFLRCIGCGSQKDLLKERLFRCESCGNLFEVSHDFSRIDSNAVAQLKRRFAARASVRMNEMPQMRSGVWRFKELIMPDIANKEIVSLGEGVVPIVPAGRHLLEWIGGNLDVWIILEGLGPTGSFKDFGGTVMMSVAKAAGVKAVGCASTGDTSAMAAAYAAAAGITCFVLLPEGKVTAVQLMQPSAHGARVITVPGPFDVCMRILQDLVRDFGVYPANSLNPARIEGHQATVFLTAQAMGWKLPNWFAVPVGNGSNTSSIGKGMRLLVDRGFVPKGSRILGCQAEAANPLDRSWAQVKSLGGANALSEWEHLYEPMLVGETAATAARIGDPVSRKKVMREIIASDGRMQTAREADILEATRVCAKDGILVCPQTGIALAGLRNAFDCGDVRDGSRVVVVSTATGLKFPGVFESQAEQAIERAPSATTSTVARMLGL